MKNPIAKILIFSSAWLLLSCSASTLQPKNCEGDASCSSKTEGVLKLPESLQNNLEGNLENQDGDTGYKSVYVDTKTKSLVVGIPLNGINIETGTTVEVKELPGVVLTVTEDDSGHPVISVSVPLETILHGATIGNPKVLPNGDPLPNIPGGELPTLHVSLNELTGEEIKVNIYLGIQVFALFVETKFDPKVKITLPIKNKDKTKILGYFVTIPQKDVHRGGFFTSIIIPDKIAKEIETILR